MTKEKKHLLGQYYTPSEVVDLILSLCLSNYSKKSLSLLDPCVGDGIFPDRISAFFEAIPRLDLDLSFLCLDVDKKAIESTKKRLNHYSRSTVEFREDNFFSLKSSPVFDMIISNPPYLRQENHSAFYKKQLRRDLETKLNLKISRRVDLYVYFFLHSYFFLVEHGRLAFITSNSFLSSVYGRPLQRFLQDHFKILFVIDSKIERFFSEAAINACITILERCESSSERNANNIKFIQFLRPLKEIFQYQTREHWSSLQEFANLVFSIEKEIKSPAWRIRVVNQRLLGNSAPNVVTSGVKGNWNIYLRAPKIYFDLLNSNDGKLIPLAEIAHISRGIRTGANKFFYQKRTALQRFQNLDLEYFKPLIKSPRGMNSLLIRPQHIQWSIFACSTPKKNLSNLLRDFISEAEKSRFHERIAPNKELWYHLKLPSPAPLLFSQVLSDRFSVFLNQAKAIADQRFIEIRPFQGENTELIAAIANSTVFYLFLELIGRNQLGEGGLDLPASDIGQLKILDPSRLDQTEKREIIDAFNPIKKRTLHRIPEELSYTDRQKLDTIILQILNQKRKKAVLYSALAGLVQNRLLKAKSILNGS
ncbi:MAG: Eco57I restriction-modification methylase domain-containing protein [Candidatus Hodarchaeota archaeon]